jgi:hypothetical protein
VERAIAYLVEALYYKPKGLDAFRLQISSLLIRSATISVTIAILDIIHRPNFYLKRDISKTGFCLRLLYLLSLTQ